MMTSETKGAKKMWIMLLGFSLITLSVTGCGTANPSQASDPQENASVSKTTLNIAIFSGPEADDIAKLAPEFEKQTGIHINFVKLSYDDLFSKELVSASSRVGTYDLFFMDDPWMPTFAGGGYLYPLSTFHYTPTGFMKGAVQVDLWPPSPPYNAPVGTTGPQRYYGVPVTGNVLTLFYNTKMLKDAGIHANPGQLTWADINKLAQASYHPTEGQYGFVLRGDGGNDSVADFSPILWAFGGDYFNKNWTSALSTPQALAALKEWLLLYHQGPSGQTSFGANQVGAYMQQGKTAAALVWPSGWAPEMPSDVKVTLVPGNYVGGHVRQAPEVGVWSLGIPKNAPHPQQAFEFLKWISAEQQQMQYAKDGLDVPTLESVITNPALDAKWPYYTVVERSFKIGHMRPRTPAWPEVETVLGTEIVQAEEGKVTPQQALSSAAQQINQYMKEHHLSQ
ncbi:extracellular solute-binding protein [Alicyclobacillus mali]|uniref:Extracellular solute-binding protein n=1 Tax=Alicyclobacillus mali (ex Roth et al. 2021) TaxID=1123961 RepID=A0ABS0F0L4_9BACL|nr:extracellular solute-binding protein [Alicyclobacillus mali (ex Roth et al. 2021)]MBF8376849.1 extracellular solute-binding protein [Alicyclobacillus mali (ex Roth et al. 2021)]